MYKYLVISLAVITIAYFSFSDKLFHSIIKEIEISGEFNYIDIRVIENKVETLLDKNIYSVSLQDVKSDLEMIPWVRSAQVSLIPPENVLVTINEHIPEFLWNEKTYINRKGDLFKTPTLLNKNVKKISSNDFTHKEMITLFEKLQSLFFDHSLTIIGLKKDSDILKIYLDDMTITVRYSKYEKKINDFINVYPEFRKKFPSKKKYKIDLRYSTGFAVQ